MVNIWIRVLKERRWEDDSKAMKKKGSGLLNGRGSDTMRIFATPHLNGGESSIFMIITKANKLRKKGSNMITMIKSN